MSKTRSLKARGSRGLLPLDRRLTDAQKARRFYKLRRRAERNGGSGPGKGLLARLAKFMKGGSR